jgi:hypothetical protein
MFLNNTKKSYFLFSVGIWLLADFDFVLSNIGTIVQRFRTIKNIKFYISTFLLTEPHLQKR